MNFNDFSSNRYARKLLGLFCLGIAFTAWGYISSLAGSGGEPGPASLKSAQPQKHHQKSQQVREALLNEAKIITKKTDSESGANILMKDLFPCRQKWGLEKTSARLAWEISQGSKDIVVAVIDTGIDINHKDLKANLWNNPGETGLVQTDFCRGQKNALALKDCNKASNGIDDDHNGIIDDVHGVDFVTNGSSLIDNHGHGTHIAGIIGAKSENGSGGVSGVSPNVSLMILKYYDPKASNTNNLRNTIQAIKYAVKMKANIINYSGGGTDYSSEELAAIKEAEQAGILVVAAAGNERSNSDETGKHYYPADYDVTNIISVTAVNCEETKVLPSSNYGVRTVDLAAPGENIHSTLPGNSYGPMTGTSQATAFVTGVAALIWSYNRDFSASDVKKYILKTGDEYTTLLSKTGTAKLLNSYRALTSLDKGVGINGVVASNTAKVGARAFAADKDLKDPKFNTSALNGGNDENDEAAESMASFSRDFVKAVSNNNIKPEIGPASVVKPR